MTPAHRESSHIIVEAPFPNLHRWRVSCQFMTAYVANHQKKQRIFEKRERELRHAIKHEYAEQKLLKVVEILREAKFRVFKCKFTARSPVQPRDFNAEQLAQHNAELKKWLEMTAEEIVAMYTSHPDQPQSGSDVKPRSGEST